MNEASNSRGPFSVNCLLHRDSVNQVEPYKWTAPQFTIKYRDLLIHMDNLDNIE